MDTLGLLPHASSPHRMSLRIRLSYTWSTWPGQCSLHCLSSVHKVGRPAQARTWMLGTLSLQLMGQRQLVCGNCSVFALAWQRLSRINSIQEGANYNYTATFTGMVSLGFSQVRGVSHPRVVAVLPMRLLMSGSKDRCITISS